MISTAMKPSVRRISPGYKNRFSRPAVVIA
jgi:hypothetical protein